MMRSQIRNPKSQIPNPKSEIPTPDYTEYMDKKTFIRVFRVIRGFLLAALVMGGSAQAAEPDKLLPNDSEYVVTLNVRLLLDSALSKKYALPNMQERLKSDQAF